MWIFFLKCIFNSEKRCIYMHTRICVCVYIYVYMCVHICIYTHCITIKTCIFNILKQKSKTWNWFKLNVFCCNFSTFSSLLLLIGSWANGLLLTTNSIINYKLVLSQPSLSHLVNGISLTFLYGQMSLYSIKLYPNGIY